MQSTSLELDAAQTEAISLCCDVTKRIVAVTGPAGTGKTSILRQGYVQLAYHGYRCVLAAPTGKAAKRIKEATGIPAMTIHRLLEYTHPGVPDPDTGEVADSSGPRRTRERPLDMDVIFIDEAAMIDMGLYRNLIDAMKSGSAVRFFGDANQLPPIEDGYTGTSAFVQLLEASHIPSVKLSTIYRQGEGSSIVRNGANILRGIAPVRYDDFGISISPTPIIRVGEVCRKLLAKDDPLFVSVRNQIITPMRQGKVGSLALNNILADIYDPGGDEVHLPRHPHETKKTGQAYYRCKVGHKVIVQANMYDLRETIEERYHEEAWIPAADHQMAFNGETGIVLSIDDGYITIDLGDRVVVFPPSLEVRTQSGYVTIVDPRREIELAYAITTHKAQGSEYDALIYMISSSGSFNQCRANFYTGITRARKQVMVIADERSLRSYSLRREQPTYKPLVKK